MLKKKRLTEAEKEKAVIREALLFLSLRDNQKPKVRYSGPVAVMKLKWAVDALFYGERSKIKRGDELVWTRDVDGFRSKSDVRCQEVSKDEREALVSIGKGSKIERWVPVRQLSYQIFD